jgi:L-erythro-3,5-diaminohexanoate dehydrogenase
VNHVDGPTLGRRGGEHRVLEPAGAAPLVARRLDALADLWDGELRLDLEAVVLDPRDHRGWLDRVGREPGSLAGAFVETIAERGGLGEACRGAVLIGRVAAVGSAHPHPATVGERVAVAFPATALPLFAVPAPAWDGGRVVPLRGHAVLPAAAVTVPIGDAEPELAAVLAATADLPSSLAPARRPVVIGVDRPAGAVAVVVLASQLRPVTAVVGSLAAARLARALGATATVVAAADGPPEEVDRIVTASGGRPDLVVLADPAGAPLAARLAPVVQLLTDGIAHPEVGGRVAEHARAAGRSVAVQAGRPLPPDRGAGLRALLAEEEVLLATLRWQAGVGSRPTVPPAGDDLEAP